MNKRFWLRARNQLRQLGEQRPTQKIFYMHIPKCGGTSVANAIRNCFTTLNPEDDRRIFHLDPYAATEAARVAKLDLLAYNRRLLPYVLGVKEYHYIYGHFAFDEAAYTAFAHQWAFITLLRDPVKKWFSLYYYNRHKQADFFKIEEDLAQFIETPTARGYGCDYVMQFAGCDDAYAHLIPDNYAYYTTKPAIEQARQNLQKFHLVGSLERLDLFAEQFTLRYGARLRIANKNRNPANQQKQAIPDAIMAKVEELCQPNRAIYQYAVDHLLTRGNQVPAKEGAPSPLATNPR